MSLIDDIRRDRETGTPGPWLAGHFANDDHPCDCRYLLAEYGGMGSLADFNVGDSQFSDDGPPKAESAANARRCARVPDMEAALLAAEELAAAVAEMDPKKYTFSTHGVRQARVDRALAAYRKATGASE